MFRTDKIFLINQNVGWSGVCTCRHWIDACLPRGDVLRDVVDIVVRRGMRRLRFPLVGVNSSVSPSISRLLLDVFVD